MKYSHAKVAFEHPAKGSHHCSECIHYQVLHCEIVQDPIRPADWCNRFRLKRAENAAGIRARAK